jgi:proteasome maturation protein
MPILPSSNLHLDILMGKDELIDYEDFLNGITAYYIKRKILYGFNWFYLDPAMSTDSLDLHATMEHKLNLRV